MEEKFSVSTILQNKVLFLSFSLIVRDLQRPTKIVTETWFCFVRKIGIGFVQDSSLPQTMLFPLKVVKGDPKSSNSVWKALSNLPRYNYELFLSHLLPPLSHFLEVTADSSSKTKWKTNQQTKLSLSKFQIDIVEIVLFLLNKSFFYFLLFWSLFFIEHQMSHPRWELRAQQCSCCWTELRMKVILNEGKLLRSSRLIT